MVLPGAPDTPWRGYSALLASCAPECGAALSRRSALHAQGAIDKAKPLRELVVPHGRRGPSASLLATHCTRDLRPEDVVEVQGLRCTTLPRTMRDLAHVLFLDPLRATAIAAQQRDLLDPAELPSQIERMRPGPPRARLQQVREDLSGEVSVDSGFEWGVRDGLVAAGMVPHPAPFPWRCPDGHVISIDIAFPHLWVAVEVEGRMAHGPANFDTDRIRWTQMSGAWDIIWVTWARWHSDRAAVMAEIADKLAAADRTRPPALPAR